MGSGSMGETLSPREATPISAEVTFSDPNPNEAVVTDQGKITFSPWIVAQKEASGPHHPIFFLLTGSVYAYLSGQSSVSDLVVEWKQWEEFLKKRAHPRTPNLLAREFEGFLDSNGTLERCIYEHAARGGSCARLASRGSFSRGLRPEHYVQELDALIGMDNDPCLIAVDNDPYLRQGSGGRFLPPSSVPYELSPHFLRPQRGNAYLRRRLFENSPLHYRCDYGVRSGTVRMSGKQLITPEDLNVIREGNSIPSNIVLSAPAAHETPQDNHLEYLCLNEYMLWAGVQIPFDYGVAEALWAFNVPPARIAPYS
ncbi:hypothetical protein ACLOJK_022993 [Asimina triloba]